MSAKKRKNNYNNLKLIVSTLLVIVLIVLLLQWIHSKKAKFIHYDAFGISMPTAYNIHGIDVSRYQKKIKWNDLKEMNIEGIQIGFVFIKATEGRKLTDKQYKYNWKHAKKQEIARGAYHFFLPNEDAVKQAKHFISKVDLSAGDLPPVLDAEQAGFLTADLFRAKIKIWLDVVEAHYKIKPIIYTNADFYKKYIGSAFNDYPLWVAHYYEKNKPRINRDWTFWQHNDRGRVNGVDAFVDFNVFKGDSTAFKKLLLP